MPLQSPLRFSRAGCYKESELLGFPSKAMRCSKCGTESIDAKKFCAACGGPLFSRCPRCAAENTPTSKFCEECGTALMVTRHLPLPVHPSLMRAVAGFGTPAADVSSVLRSTRSCSCRSGRSMVLGSLRDKLRYPNAGDATEEEQLEALKEVNLVDLSAPFGGLDVGIALGGRAFHR